MKNKYSLIATGLFLALGTAQGQCVNGTYNSPYGFSCSEMDNSDSHWTTNFENNTVNEGTENKIYYGLNGNKYSPNITFNGDNSVNDVYMKLDSGVAENDASIAIQSGTLNIVGGGLRIINDTSKGANISAEKGASLHIDSDGYAIDMSSGGHHNKLTLDLSKATNVVLNSSSEVINMYRGNSVADVFIDLRKTNSSQVRKISNSYQWDVIHAATYGSVEIHSSGDLTMGETYLGDWKKFGIHAEINPNRDADTNIDPAMPDTAYTIITNEEGIINIQGAKNAYTGKEVDLKDASAAIGSVNRPTVFIHNKTTGILDSAGEGIYVYNHGKYAGNNGVISIVNDGTIKTGHVRKLNEVNAIRVINGGAKTAINIQNTGTIHVATVDGAKSSVGVVDLVSHSSAISVRALKSAAIQIQNTSTIINDRDIYKDENDKKIDAAGIEVDQTYGNDPAAGIGSLNIDNSGTIQSRSLGISTSADPMGETNVVITNTGSIHVNKDDPKKTELEVYGIKSMGGSMKTIHQNGELIVGGAKSIGILMGMANTTTRRLDNTINVAGTIDANSGIRFVENAGSLGVTNTVNIAKTGKIISNDVAIESNVKSTKNSIVTSIINDGIIESKNNQAIKYNSHDSSKETLIIKNTGTITGDISVGSAKTAVTNEGTWNIQNRAGQNSLLDFGSHAENTFVNNGTLKLLNSNVTRGLRATQSSHIKGLKSFTLENGGVIDMTNNQSDTLTIGGDFVANGGEIKMDVGSQTSDLLKLANIVKGTAKTNINLNVTQIDPNAKEIKIFESITNDLGAFKLNAPVVSGAYEYVLADTGTGVFLSSQNTTPVVPVDPNPVDPNPVDPNPVDPNPVDPNPVDPNPVDPNPVDPNPVDPNPVDPNPVDPNPVDPNPVDPNPVDPNPVDPNPVSPNPVDPTPVDPTNPTEVGSGGASWIASLTDHDPNRIIRADAGIVMANQTAVTALLSPIHFAGDFSKAGGLRAMSRLGVEQGDGGDTYKQRNSFWLTTVYHDMKSTLAKQIAHKSKIATIQLGYNHNMDVGSNALLELGITAGYNDVDTSSISNRTGTKAEGSVKGYNFAMSGSLFLNGTDPLSPYLDIMLAHGRYKNTVSIKNTYSRNYKSNATMGYLQGGYPIALGSAVAIEPQAQITYIKYHGNSYTDHSNTVISQDNKGFIVTRVGMSVYGRNMDLQPYATVNWYNNGQQSAVNLNKTRIRAEKVGNIFELKGGVQFKPSQNLTISAEAGVQTGSRKYRDYNGAVNFKYSF